jgi:magnesium-transporting ATPase (P-type)
VNDKDLPLGDRTNLCYSSTVVTQGRGTGIVVATGMNAQIGKIADALSNKNSKNGTPKVEKPSLYYRVKETIIEWSYVLLMSVSHVHAHLLRPVVRALEPHSSAN